MDNEPNKIFELTPNKKKLEDRNWHASPHYKGIVIVRAKNEKKARLIAAKYLYVARDTELPQLFCPWDDVPNLVDCKELKDSKYSVDEDEKEEMLEPSPSMFI